MKLLHVLSASGLSFYLSIALAKIRALLRMVFPMLMSCGSFLVCRSLWLRYIFLILLKIIAVHRGCIDVGVRWLVLRTSSGR